MVRKIDDKRVLVRLVTHLIMHDGGVYMYKGCRNAAFAMNHTSWDYVMYAKSILENITSVRIVEVDNSTNTDGCDRKRKWRVSTPQHPLFTMIRERVYHEETRYKGLCSRALKDMDAECLAMLYMADGSIGYKGAAINSVSLNTKRLTEGDNRWLSLMIEKVFGVQSTINRQNKYTYVRVKGKSLYRFFKLIEGYILDDFKYKLPNDELLEKYRQDGEIV